MHCGQSFGIQSLRPISSGQVNAAVSNVARPRRMSSDLRLVVQDEVVCLVKVSSLEGRRMSSLHM